jgi:hypothetical protein
VVVRERAWAGGPPVPAPASPLTNRNWQLSQVLSAAPRGLEIGSAAVQWTYSGAVANWTHNPLIIWSADTPEEIILHAILGVIMYL